MIKKLFIILFCVAVPLTFAYAQYSFGEEAQITDGQLKTELADLQSNLDVEKLRLDNINMRFQLNDIQIKQLQAQNDNLKRVFADTNNTIKALEAKIKEIQQKLKELKAVKKDEK